MMNMGGGGQFPPGDPSGPSQESVALQAALETRPSGQSISQLPPEILELAAALGLDPQNPEEFMQLMILMSGGGGNIPGAVPVEEEQGAPMMPPQGGPVG